MLSSIINFGFRPKSSAILYKELCKSPSAVITASLTWAIWIAKRAAVPLLVTIQLKQANTDGLGTRSQRGLLENSIVIIEKDIKTFGLEAGEKTKAATQCQGTAKKSPSWMWRRILVSILRHQNSISPINHRWLNGSDKRKRDREAKRTM